ncbi:MAG: hypothetical protein ACI4I8_01850 [Oscillospiraceae bacterium]
MRRYLPQPVRRPPLNRLQIHGKAVQLCLRQLNPYRALMEFEYGICCKVERTVKGRTLHLTKIENDDTPTHSTNTVTTITG